MQAAHTQAHAWDGQNFVSQAGAFESLASGLLLGGYEATRFKAKAQTSKLALAVVHTNGLAADEHLQAGVAFAKGTLLAR